MQLWLTTTAGTAKLKVRSLSDRWIVRYSIAPSNAANSTNESSIRSPLLDEFDVSGMSFDEDERLGKFMATSDIGNVSWEVPAMQPIFHIDAKGPNHSIVSRLGMNYGGALLRCCSFDSTISIKNSSYVSDLPGFHECRWRCRGAAEHPDRSEGHG